MICIWEIQECCRWSYHKANWYKRYEYVTMADGPWIPLEILYIYLAMSLFFTLLKWFKFAFLSNFPIAAIFHILYMNMLLMALPKKVKIKGWEMCYCIIKWLHIYTKSINSFNSFQKILIIEKSLVLSKTIFPTFSATHFPLTLQKPFLISRDRNIFL